MSKRLFLTSLLLAMLVMMLAACQSQTTPAAPVVESAATAAPTVAAAVQEESATISNADAVESGGEAASDGALILRFVNGGTQARFLIDEVLLGQDKTVVGVTSLVEGELTVDPGDLASVQLGEVRIDARGFTTDDDRRTNRLRNDILRSAQDAYRYITFTPTSIEGLPASAAPGDSLSFQVTGDLKILDTTQPVTFAMNVTAVDSTTVQGGGTATIRYADFGINIPRVPMVASVEDEVILEIDFTAQADG
jgi:polyisoprenoid-binding protein YceI